MNKELESKWAEAERTGQPVDIGRIVVCDFCDADYTDSADAGGFIFSSKAVCPKCAPATLESAARYGEQRFIRARCPDGKSFADFVREYRGKTGNIIQVRSMPSIKAKGGAE
jgi:hypothetical protein